MIVSSSSTFVIGSLVVKVDDLPITRSISSSSSIVANAKVVKILQCNKFKALVVMSQMPTFDIVVLTNIFHRRDGLVTANGIVKYNGPVVVDLSKSWRQSNLLHLFFYYRKGRLVIVVGDINVVKDSELLVFVVVIRVLFTRSSVVVGRCCIKIPL